MEPDDIYLSLDSLLIRTELLGKSPNSGISSAPLGIIADHKPAGKIRPAPVSDSVSAAPPG